MEHIDTRTILQAYAMGIFPMAEDASNPEVQWFKPQQRGLIPLDERFHVPKSLKKTLRRGDYTIRYNHNFHAVLDACAGGITLNCPRPDTWINADIRRLYQELHQQNHAHSLEVYNNENMLIGGLYGVTLGGAFFGESMFSNARDASKIALVHLVKHLRKQRFLLLDCQFLTDHLQQFGAYTVAAAEYDEMLYNALQHQCVFTNFANAN